MKKIVTLLALLALAISVQAATLLDTVNGIFNVADTNSLIHAQTLDITPTFTYDSASRDLGGTLKLGWWITQQQGAGFWFYENERREQFWSLSYDVRTVFKQVELGLATGVQQPMASNLGNDLRAYLQPNLCYRFNQNLGLFAGATFFNGDRPRIDIGLRFTWGR